MDLYQVLLPSGRAVRFRLLPPNEHNEAFMKAATAVGQGATAAAMRIAHVHEALKLMLRAATRKTVPSMDVANAPETQWVDLNPQLLELGGELQYDRLFTSKDDAVLNHLYSHYHELTKAEGDAIVGKVQQVSVG